MNQRVTRVYVLRFDPSLRSTAHGSSGRLRDYELTWYVLNYSVADKVLTPRNHHPVKAPTLSTFPRTNSFDQPHLVRLGQLPLLAPSVCTHYVVGIDKPSVPSNPAHRTNLTHEDTPKKAQDINIHEDNLESDPMSAVAFACS